jgi:prepilin-type N-terminal cleavage/methylation domain-containing protein
MTIQGGPAMPQQVAAGPPRIARKALSRDISMMNRNTESERRVERGFSLLELLIVVGIILIIATIAIPSLIRSRQSANETAAVSTLQLFNASQNIYMTGAKVFGTVNQLIADDLIDERFLGPKSGYEFEVVLSGDALDYVMTATAESPNAGRYDYYTTPDFVLRYSSDAGRAPSGKAGLPVQ